MRQVVIYGIGKMAEFIYYSFQYDSDYDVIGFCVDNDYIDISPKTLFNLPVICYNDLSEISLHRTSLSILPLAETMHGK